MSNTPVEFSSKDNERLFKKLRPLVYVLPALSFGFGCLAPNLCNDVSAERLATTQPADATTTVTDTYVSYDALLTAPTLPNALRHFGNTPE